MENRISSNAADELREIKEQMLELLSDAQTVLREAPEIVKARAEAYWRAHIRCAIDNEHGYLGRSMVTLQDTIDELEGAGDGDKSSPSSKSPAQWPIASRNSAACQAENSTRALWAASAWSNTNKSSTRSCAPSSCASTPHIFSNGSDQGGLNRTKGKPQRKEPNP